MIDLLPVYISPRQVIVNFYLQIWQKFMILVYRNSNPGPSVCCHYSIPICKPLIVLSVIHHDKHIRNTEFMKKTRIWEILWLVYGGFQLDESCRKLVITKLVYFYRTFFICA